MSTSNMTTTAVVLGILAVGTAIPAWYRPAVADQTSADLSGKPLIRGDKEIAPEQIADLMVATWDDSQSKALRFQVKKSDGRWIIPSYFSYPADGGSRVGNTAGGVLNVPRGPLVTRDPKQHKELGVIDPTPKEGTPTEKSGIGKRVTLKDQTGATAVDLIVGNSATNGEGMRYVRDADSNDVYTAKVSADISTTFTDWVETGLLKFSSDDVRSVIISDYFVDEARGAVNTRSETAFDRKDSASDWLSLQKPADKQVAKDVVNKILSEGTGLKLQGVRPYRNEWLTQRGFYVGNDKQLYGNEGRVVITTKDGLRYALFFGEVALGDDADQDEGAAKKQKDANKDKAITGNNRYLAVFVQYDEKTDDGVKAAAEKKAAEAKAEKKDEKKDEAKKDEKTPQQIGAEKAKKAQAKFGSYFYVISDDSFKSLKPAVDKLFEAKPKPEEKKDGAAAPAAGPAVPPLVPPTP